MGFDVLSADVRQSAVVAMRLCIQNKCTFSPVPWFAKYACAEVKSEFHGHVESRNAALGDFDARQVVNTPVALAYHRCDLAKSNLGTVVCVQRATRVVS